MPLFSAEARHSDLAITLLETFALVCTQCVFNMRKVLALVCPVNKTVSGCNAFQTCYVSFAQVNTVNHATPVMNAHPSTHSPTECDTLRNNTCILSSLIDGLSKEA